MTKKDYIRIARQINTVRNSYAPTWDLNLFRALDDVTNSLALYFAYDNPVDPSKPGSGFNRERFIDACKR